MSVTKPKVLLVGGGLTSAVLASLLDKQKMKVSVWDKAGRSGGRMTSHRRVGGEGQVDLGAQYITATPTYQECHDMFYKELVSVGMLRPLIATTNSQLVDKVTRIEIGERLVDVGDREKKGVYISLDDKFWEEPENREEPVNLVRSSNYVAPLGVESIVNYFWEKSGLMVDSFHPLQQLNKVGKKWVAKTGQKEEQYDCVVTTMPVPQLMGENPAPEGVIGGNFLDIIKEDQDLFNNLSSVKYNTIFCLGLFYDTALTGLGFNWKAKYFPRDPVIRYISIDNIKRGDKLSPTAIGVQCQVSYSMENRHRSKGEMTDLMMDHLNTLLPNLPPPSSVLSHKWRYSQTSQPFPGEPGCALLHSSPPLIGAGDSFTHSNMDGCILSARVTKERVCQVLNIEK